jgi:hypothetical protein
MWDYQPDADVNDLKTCAFDYIRLGQHQEDFRDIIRTPSQSNSSFFATKDLWSSFKKKHFEVVDSNPEISVEEIIRENAGADVSRLLKARDHEWREKVKEKLNENFNAHKDRLNNKLESNEPIRLLSKALDALFNINNSSLKEVSTSEIGVLITSIEIKLSEIKNTIKK